MATQGFVNFKAVKARVSIQDVLARYGILGTLTAKGNRLVGLCPIHHKGGPAPGKSHPQQFSVDLAKNAWKCFAGSCGKSGNQIDLVAALEKIEFRAAALLMQDWVPSVHTAAPKAPEGLRSAEEPAESATAELPKENKPLAFELKLDTAHPYLAQRGLTPETIGHFGLGLAVRGSMQGRIAIPIHNEGGELVAYAGRWVGPEAELPEGEGKYKLPAKFHKSLVVYNLHRVPADVREVIVVEGYWSVFTLHQAGVGNVVSLMGSSLSPEQAKLLRDRFDRVRIFFDGDEAGRTAAAKVAGALAAIAWVTIVYCPDGLQPDRLSVEELQALVA